MKKYKVNLKDKAAWNSDFIKDCEKCNYIFEVERSDSTLVWLYKPGQHTYSWNHDIHCGEFVEEKPKVVPIKLLIEKEMFEI